MDGQNNSGSFGVNLWWTVPGLVVPAQQVQDLLLKHGFKVEDIKEPSDRVEVSRAVHSFQNRRTKKDRKLAEIASEQVDAVTYGILNRVQTGDSVNFEQETTVRYDKQANTVTVTGALAQEVEDALVEYKDKITDQDVRVFLKNVVKKCHGVSKRPSGGIYFIPAQFGGAIELAQAFLAELSTGAKLYVERVVDGEPERKIVWEAVEEDIDDQLAGVMAGVERIERRVSALKNQEARIDELRELMKVYQDLLGKEAKHEDMAAKLDAAVATIAQKMETLQGQMEDPAPKAKSGTGRGPSQNDYFEAALAVLKAENGPLHCDEIAKRVVASGYEGVVPPNVYAHFSYRAKKGLLKMTGKSLFACNEEPVALSA